MEEWLDVDGWEGRYQVSSKGRVRSVDRTIINSLGRKRFYPGKILAPSLNRYGYEYVYFYRQGERPAKRIHRLVAEAFLPNPDNYPVVRHLNDVKTDNDTSNLAWGTYSDNSLDAIRNGKNSWVLRTACKYGHEYKDGNYTLSRKGTRVCLICSRAAGAEYYEKNKELVLARQRDRYRKQQELKKG